jgi:predicted NBD/HSP70 family sugar kinase
MDAVQRRILAEVWRHGRANRAQLARVLALRANTVCDACGALVESGWLRAAGRQERTGREGVGRVGRPPDMLEIDRQRRRVLCVVLKPGKVELALSDLTGQAVGQIASRRVGAKASVVDEATALVREHLREHADVVAAGVVVPGLIDTQRRVLLFSSATPKRQDVSLEPLFEALSGRVVVVDNMIHAVGERFRLTDPDAHQQDVVLVWLGDGELSASIMLSGPPNRGSVHSSNELGHMTLPVKTARCYCGQIGCLERIVSTAQLKRMDPGATGSLLNALGAAPMSPAATTIVRHLGRTLANTVNLLRPQRLVLTGPLTQVPGLAAMLEVLVRRRAMPVLAQRVAVEVWSHQAPRLADLAAWLALGAISGQRQPTAV